MTSGVNILQETLYYFWQETVETGKKIVGIPLYVNWNFSQNSFSCKFVCT